MSMKKLLALAFLITSPALADISPSTVALASGSSRGTLGLIDF
jgi:hypothetical protein